MKELVRYLRELPRAGQIGLLVLAAGVAAELIVHGGPPALFLSDAGILAHTTVFVGLVLVLVGVLQAIARHN